MLKAITIDLCEMDGILDEFQNNCYNNLYLSKGEENQSRKGDHREL